MITVFHAAEIAAEAVFIQLFVRGHIPEAAGIGRNFIRQHHGAVRRFSEFQLEVDQLDVDLREVFGENPVDFQGIFCDLYFVSSSLFLDTLICSSS